MAVMAREAWTDERLDDLKENVNQRFDVVDRRFDEVDKRFDKVNARFDKVDKRFERVEAEMKAGFAEVTGRIDNLSSSVHQRIDALQRTMIIGFCGMSASIIGALLATQL